MADLLAPSARGAASNATPSADHLTGTSGLAVGLCVAMVLVFIFGFHVMKGRSFRAAAGHALPASHERAVVLTREALNTLPTVRYRMLPPRNFMSDLERQPCGITSITDQLCSICTEPFLDDAELRKLPCSHAFHDNCVDPWLLRRSATCPLCRREVATRLRISNPKLPTQPSRMLSTLRRLEVLRHESRGFSSGTGSHKYSEHPVAGSRIILGCEDSGAFTPSPSTFVNSGGIERGGRGGRLYGRKRLESIKLLCV